LIRADAAERQEELGDSTVAVVSPAP
jgi:hypothetical protein